MRRLSLLALSLFISAAAASGCARSVTLNPDAGQTYAVNVVNELPEAMIVSFDDGTGARILGTVAANREERFVVATGGGTITLVARNEADTRTVRRTVTLAPGETVTVRLN